MKRINRTSAVIDITALEVAGSDDRLNCYHISLYTALLYYGNGLSKIPFYASRRKLMGFSRIKSAATYHKCLRELISYGYICYIPSFHPQLGSRIVLTVSTIKPDANR